MYLSMYVSNLTPPPPPVPHLDVVGYEGPELLAASLVLELEVGDGAAAVAPGVQVQGDPGDVDGDEFVAVGRRVVGLGALGSRLDDLARRAHADAIVGGQVDLVVGAAPELRQLVAAALVGELDLLPLAELPLEVEDVAADRGAPVVAVFPLDVYRVAGCARRVEHWSRRWYCKHWVSFILFFFAIYSTILRISCRGLHKGNCLKFRYRTEIFAREPVYKTTMYI
jgi:hypothetical protein